MPTHDIEMDLPSHKVVNTDVDVVVKSDGRMLGTVMISKGSIDWRPGRASSLYTMSWERFDALMRDHGRRV
jgi:hypothetical protein